MNTEEKEIFLPIDGVEELIERYCKILEDKSRVRNHAVVISGDTGCGKKCFCNECARRAKEKNGEVVEVNMVSDFTGSSLESEEKLRKTLEIIEYELTKRNTFKELGGKCQSPEIFKRELRQMLEKKETTLLIQFPKIEVFEEIEKYYNTLSIKNTIMYFIIEKNNVVNECRQRLGRNIEYFKCMRLKEGDGKLIIDNYFSGKAKPRFRVEDIESYMANKPQDNKATVKALMEMCDIAYKYAENNNIGCITKSVILDAMTFEGRV